MTTSTTTSTGTGQTPKGEGSAVRPRGVGGRPYARLMTTRRTPGPARVATLLAVLALLLTAAVTSSSAAAPAERAASDSPSQFRGKDVVHFDLFYTGTVAPKRIFFTANSGPYLRGMKWEGWGTKRTVGRGVYVSKCASCAPPKRRAAKVVLSKRRYCEAQDVYYYKRGILTRKPSEGQDRKARIGGGVCGERD